MSKFEELESAARDWHRAKIIREYIEALEQRKVGLGFKPEEEDKFIDYIIWAKEKADWLDPLTAKTDAILGKRSNRV